MILNEVQQDALTEIIHIGYGRAASALSAMTHQRVQLAVPELSLVEVRDLHRSLGLELGSQMVSVNQTFLGPISGTAMLLLERKAAISLARILGETSATGALDGYTGDIITEVGNIQLNACLGVFGSLLRVQINFAVPVLHADATAEFFKSIQVQSEPLSHAVVVKTRFTLKDTEVAGVMVMVMGVTSLERVLQRLDGWQPAE